jgi:putative PIN family toxin of toxin-antitoxin system
VPLRLVLDTNIWLDLLVFRDPGVETLKTAVGSGSVDVFIDENCEHELARVLAYPRRKTTLDAAAQTACLAEFRKIAQVAVRARECEGAGDAIPLPRCRDPDDQKFLDLARDCRADFLITKDNALLELARRKTRTAPFRIVTPRQFSALDAQ